MALNKTLIADLKGARGLQGIPGIPGPGAVENDAAVAAYVAAATATQSALDTRFTRKFGTRGTTKTIYVRATGNDLSDGLTEGTALREIRTAVASLDFQGPILRGSNIIDVGAGTYKPGIMLPQVRGYAADDFVKIIGPTAGHPNVPTAVIDASLDVTFDYGIRAFDGVPLWLQDIKLRGAFSIAIDVRRGVYLQLRNVHMDGLSAGLVGLGIMIHCRYAVHGGLIENFVDSGIQEHFHVFRSFDTVGTNAAQMTIRNCDTGLQAKENCVGHLDNLNVEDCGTGIELNGMCVANAKQVDLKRNDLALANINSEFHNWQSATFGTGADANTREYVEQGSAATDLSAWGWTGGSDARTSSIAHRPLITVAASYSDVTLTGPIAEGIFYDLVQVLKAHRYIVPGRKFRVVVRGAVGAAALVADYRLVLRVAGEFVTDVAIPAGTAAGARFRAEFEVVCSANGNNQKAFAETTGQVSARSNYAVRTTPLTASDSSVRVAGVATNAGDSLTLRTVEVWG